MRRALLLFIACLAAAAITIGCGGDAAKGVNKDKDKPRPADKTADKP